MAISFHFFFNFVVVFVFFCYFLLSFPQMIHNALSCPQVMFEAISTNYAQCMLSSFSCIGLWRIWRMMLIQRSLKFYNAKFAVYK